MCHKIKESDRDVGYNDTNKKCNCDESQYHHLCLRKYRNPCEKSNNRMKCISHQNKIHQILNNKRVQVIENDHECLICQDGLGTNLNWGKFVCKCKVIYHYKCLQKYKNNEGSYHKISRDVYDLTRLKCIVCRKSPREITRF